MNMKEMKNMRKFNMCRSLDVTTSCMIPDCRSVIRSRRSSDQTLVEHTRLLSNTKYIRLAERRGFVVPASRRSSSSSLLSLAASNNVKVDQNALQLSSNIANQVFQVVVMRVSIHCQGCAGKVKKHLSKMEGVTSFSIDLETKSNSDGARVTSGCVGKHVEGEESGVLASQFDSYVNKTIGNPLSKNMDCIFKFFF